jgi:hypothetical protein
MSTRTYTCRRCADEPAFDCPHCRYINATAREAEERIEFLIDAATIFEVPETPTPLFWLLAEHQVCAN